MARHTPAPAPPHLPVCFISSVSVELENHVDYATNCSIRHWAIFTPGGEKQNKNKKYFIIARDNTWSLNVRLNVVPWIGN